MIFEAYPEVGFNYRMTDIQAAVGREQLKRLPEIVARAAAARRRATASCWPASPASSAPREPAWARSNWQSYCVRLPDGVDQRAVMQAMLDAGISTRRGIMCTHREPAYSAGSRTRTHPAPAQRSGTGAGRHPADVPRMTDDQVQAVVRDLLDACAIALSTGFRPKVTSFPHAGILSARRET